MKDKIKKFSKIILEKTKPDLLKMKSSEVLEKKSMRNDALPSKWNDKFASFSSSSFSVKEQTHFIKRFSFLIRAGVPVSECLLILRQQAVSRGHALVLDKIIEDISNGRSLSKSFAKFPKYFNNFAVYIIKVGESTGMLDQTLSYLADELKKKQALRRKVVGAFIYPAIITVATLGITVFLMVYLFPKIMPIFTSLNIKLPLSTRIVIILSTFFQKWWLAVFALIALFIVAVKIILDKNLKFHYIFDRTILRVPAIGNVVKHYNIANGSRTLGLLLKSGITIRDALPITAETTTNLVYKKQWSALAEVVNRGEPLAATLLKMNALFPDIFGHMISVGEKSGTLSDTLVYLSELYETEVDEFTKNLSTVIEPVLMVAMGLIVGFIAISIITPIYSITQNLHG